MEESENQSVFDSLNFRPHLFINEILNALDDLFDGAFEFYEQQASELLGKMKGGGESAALSQAVSLLYQKIQATLDKRMGMWEKYCAQHCFSLPEGFSLPKVIQPLAVLEAKPSSSWQLPWSENYDGASLGDGGRYERGFKS